MPNNTTKTNAVDGLSPFEGRDVLQAGIKIKGAEKPVTHALMIEPAEYHHGEKVFMVLECDVVDVQHPALKEAEGCVKRLHVFETVAGTIVDSSLVADALNKQKEINEAAKKSPALPGMQETDGEPS